MDLAPSFSLEEFMVTSHTDLYEQNRREADDHLPELQVLAYGLAQPIRDHFGKPLIITSGFRGPTLNARVGGSSTSQHMSGQAMDFHVKDVLLDDVFDWIFRKSGLRWGQLILEETGSTREGKTRWIHLSLGYPYRSRARSGEVKRMVNGSWSTLAVGVNF